MTCKLILAYCKHIFFLYVLCFCFSQKANSQCSGFSFYPTIGYDCLTATAFTNYTVSGALAPYTSTFVNGTNNATVTTGYTASNTGTVLGLPQGSYIIYVTAANGCTLILNPVLVTIVATASNVSFAPASIASITCFGANNASAVAVPPSTFTNSPPPSYTWSPGSIYTPAATNLSANVVYSVTVKDARGCVATNTLSFNDPPEIESTFTNTFITCFGNALNTSIATINNVGATTYSLNGNALTSGIVNNLLPGLQTIRTRDSKGCVNTNTVLIEQELQTLINTTVIKPTCPGKSDGTINATVSSAPSPFNYTWTPGNVFTSNLNNIPNGNYTLSVLDANGCTTKSVTLVLPALSATVSAVTKKENCSASDGSFTLTVAGVNPPFTFTTLPIGAHSGNIVNNISSGNYTSITNYNNNCIDTLRFTVGNLSTVSLSIQNSFPILCFNNCTGSVTVNATNGIAPLTYSTANTASSTSNLFTGLCAGFHEFKVVDALGCPATATINFVSPAPFTYTASAPTIVCSGVQVSLQGSATGGSGGYVFLWTPGNINGQFVNTTPVGTTAYSLNVYDSNGCTQAPSVVTITVRPPITININSSNSGICPGSTAQITPTISGGDGNYTYRWLPGNSTAPFIYVENITVPIYSLSVNDGCGSTTANRLITINLFPVSKPLFKTKASSGCEPFCTSFINTTPASSMANWNFGDNSVAQTGDTSNYCYQYKGIYNLSLSIIDSNSCRSSITYTNAIEVLESPKANFASDPIKITINHAENVPINNLTANGEFYQWFINDRLYSQEPTIKYSFADTGCYKFVLVARNNSNCVDTASKYICVEEDFNFFMPNVFTPNGNGNNDILIPKGTGWLTENYQFEIFNRWGRRIFKTDDVLSGWDADGEEGRYPTGNYVWLVKITDTRNKEHAFRGTFILFR